MPRGAPAVKLAISVDRDVHAKVLRAARQQKLSISAWMTEAARRALALRDGLTAVAEWEREHGSLSDAELAAASERVRRAAHSRTRSPRR